MTKLLLAVTLAVLSGNAVSETTGRMLYGWCQGDKNSQGETACLTYVSGVYDGAMMWWVNSFVASRKNTSEPLPKKDAPACIKEGINPVALANVAKGYLAANPDLLDSPAQALLLDAFKAAFPCR